MKKIIFTLVVLSQIFVPSFMLNKATASDLNRARVEKLKKELEVKMDAFLAGMSEQAQRDWTYRMYKRAIKSRNKLTGWTDEKFDRRMERLSQSDFTQGEANSPEALALEADLDRLDLNIANDLEAQPDARVTRIQYVEMMDKSLTDLGVTRTETGRLKPLSRADFFKHLDQTQKSETQDRKPSSIRSIWQGSILHKIGLIVLLVIGFSLLFLILGTIFTYAMLLTRLIVAVALLAGVTYVFIGLVE